MYITCLCVTWIHACAYGTDILQLNICSFYLNVNTRFLFFFFVFFKCVTKSCPPLWKIQDSRFSPNILCPTLFRKGAFIFYFYTISCWSFLRLFPYFPFPLNFPSVTSGPHLFVSKSKGRHHFLPAEKGKHSHNRSASGWREIQSHINWKSQQIIYYCSKGTYFSVFLLLQNPWFSVHIG